MTGTFQVWPGHNPGVLGTRPHTLGAGVPTGHALTAQGTHGAVPGFFTGVPPGYGAPGASTPGWTPSPPAPYWNQQALANSFSTMMLTPPSSSEWYMDSRADAHMTSSSILLHRLVLLILLSVTGPCYLLPPLVILVFLPSVLYILIMFLFLPTLLKISYLFKNLLLTIHVLSNLILLASL